MFGLKKLSALTVGLFLAISPALNAKEMVSVSKPQANLRSGAGTQHSAIWVLSKGFPLMVTARRGNWLKVRDYENDVGWVYRPLVGKTPYVIVKSSVANLRSAPSTTSRIVGKAVYGDTLRTLAHQNTWVRIQNKGGTRGWVARSLVWGW